MCAPECHGGLGAPHDLLSAHFRTTHTWTWTLAWSLRWTCCAMSLSLRFHGRSGAADARVSGSGTEHGHGEQVRLRRQEPLSRLRVVGELSDSAGLRGARPGGLRPHQAPGCCCSWFSLSCSGGVRGRRGCPRCPGDNKITWRENLTVLKTPQANKNILRFQNEKQSLLWVQSEMWLFSPGVQRVALPSVPLNVPLCDSAPPCGQRCAGQYWPDPGCSDGKAHQSPALVPSSGRVTGGGAHVAGTHEGPAGTPGG